MERKILKVFLRERCAGAEYAVRPVVVRGEGYAAEGCAAAVIGIVGVHPFAAALERLHEGLVLGELQASFELQQNTKERRYINWSLCHNRNRTLPPPSLKGGSEMRTRVA